MNLAPMQTQSDPFTNVHAKTMTLALLLKSVGYWNECMLDGVGIVFCMNMFSLRSILDA